MFIIRFDSEQFGLAVNATFVSTFVERVDNSIYLNGNIVFPNGTVIKGYIALITDSPIKGLYVYYGEGENEDGFFGTVVA